MTRLTLTVNMLAGTDIERGCAEVMALAERLDIIILCMANGVELMAIPGEGNAKNLFDNWDRALKSKAAHQIATSRFVP